MIFDSNPFFFGVNDSFKYGQFWILKNILFDGIFEQITVVAPAFVLSIFWSGHVS